MFNLAKKRLYYLLILLVSLTNPWAWLLLQKSPILLLLLILLTFLLLHLFRKRGVKEAIFVIILIFLISILETRAYLNTNDWKRNPAQISLMAQRHGYLSETLGEIYKNKFALIYYTNYEFIFDRYWQNLFDNLDINLFFFKNHPRERPGVNELDKYWPLYLPFFLFGLYKLFKNPYKPFLACLTLIILLSGLSSRNALGPILYFPLVNSLIIMGLNEN